MGKEDILKVLKKKRKWMTSKEISEELTKKLGIKNVCTPLRKMRDSGEIKFKTGKYKSNNEGARFGNLVYYYKHPNT